MFKERGSEIILNDEDWKKLLQESSIDNQLQKQYGFGASGTDILEMFILVAESKNNPIKTKEALMEATKVFQSTRAPKLRSNKRSRSTTFSTVTENKDVQTWIAKNFD